MITAFILKYAVNTPAITLENGCGKPLEFDALGDFLSLIDHRGVPSNNKGFHGFQGITNEVLSLYPAATNFDNLLLMPPKSAS